MIKTLQEAKLLSLNAILDGMLGGIGGDLTPAHRFSVAIGQWKSTATSTDIENYDTFARHNLTGLVDAVRQFIAMRAQEEGLTPSSSTYQN